MYKKKQFLKLEKKYNSYQDAGSVGAMMQLCHEKLEDHKYLNNTMKYRHKDGQNRRLLHFNSNNSHFQ